MGVATRLISTRDSNIRGCNRTKIGFTYALTMATCISAKFLDTQALNCGYLLILIVLHPSLDTACSKTSLSR